MSQVFLECANVQKSFGGIQATKGLNLKLSKHKVVGLIGPNGAGKTTAFNLITGFLKPDGGKIICKGQEITKWPPYRITALGIARTWQNLRLFAQLTVEENLLLACQDQPGENLFKSIINPRLVKQVEKVNEQKAEMILKKTGLYEKRHHPAADLSYAEQKLLVLSRAMIMESECVLLDEPMSGMDGVTLMKTKELVRNMAAEGKAVCLIEHNVDFIAEVCDEVLFLDHGQVIAQGTAEEIMSNEELTTIYFGK
jgi:branched-chain amino acid transport system permease protein